MWNILRRFVVVFGCLTLADQPGTMKIHTARDVRLNDGPQKPEICQETREIMVGHV